MLRVGKVTACDARFVECVGVECGEKHPPGQVPWRGSHFGFSLSVISGLWRFSHPRIPLCDRLATAHATTKAY